MTPDVSILKASEFLSHIGGNFQMVDQEGLEIFVQLIRCNENPRGEMPGALRTPFSLQFETDAEDAPHIQWGNFSFAHSDIPAFGPVYVTRILNTASPNKALFQVVFG